MNLKFLPFVLYILVGVQIGYGANNPLKRSALHLHGLLPSPAGSCCRLAPLLCV